jgi:hypothetical protein
VDHPLPHGRFLRLPEQIELLVRENHGHHEPGPLRHIHGEQHHVERRVLAAGARGNSPPSWSGSSRATPSSRRT